MFEWVEAIGIVVAGIAAVSIAGIKFVFSQKKNVIQIQQVEEEIKDIISNVKTISDDVMTHRLHVAETYAKKDEIVVALTKMQDRLDRIGDAIWEISAKGKG